MISVPKPPGARSVRLATRSGALRASRQAAAPPWNGRRHGRGKHRERQGNRQRRARRHPRHRCAASRAPCPWPGRSKVIVRRCLARRSERSPNPRASPANPCRRTTGAAPGASFGAGPVSRNGRAMSVMRSVPGSGLCVWLKAILFDTSLACSGMTGRIWREGPGRRRKCFFQPAVDRWRSSAHGI